MSIPLSEFNIGYSHNLASVLEWSEIGYTLNNWTVLSGVTGQLSAGKMLAVLGPSGAGKSTFLDVLAGRKRGGVQGSVKFHGSTDFKMQEKSYYVEQEDALYGALTVRQTVSFAARLSTRQFIEDTTLRNRIDTIIEKVGLKSVTHSRIGNQIQRGISGGQKRRATLAAALVVEPEILFLDEVTSGLDSTASFKVLEAVKRLAKELGICVIATVHQPAWSTLRLFDSLLVLSDGKSVYNGPVNDLPVFCASSGHPVPTHSNPADHIIALVNPDFGAPILNSDIAALSAHNNDKSAIITSFATPARSRSKGRKQNTAIGYLATVYLLLQRTLLNYSRNLLAYGIRVGMYVGMAAMVSLVWLHIGEDQSRINDRLSVHFYGVAFLSFMSVAGVPAFLEHRAIYLRERKNGLVSPSAFVLATAIADIPFLIMCTLLYTSIAYGSLGLHKGAGHYFRYTSYVFLCVYAAEAQTALIASILPIFVAALAVAAFANGFLMSVQGYFNRNLPGFWYHSFHFMDYETYAFQLLVQDDFHGLTFKCNEQGANESCDCLYPSTLQQQDQCSFRGEDVTANLGFSNLSTGSKVAILISICVIYRIACWGVLRVKHQ